MKQGWRIGTSVTPTGPDLGVFALGCLCYVYIPSLAGMGYFGAIIQHFALILSFGCYRLVL